MRRFLTPLSASLSVVLLSGVIAAPVVAADPVPSSVVGGWADGNVLQDNHEVVLEAVVVTDSPDFAPDATMTFESTDGGPSCQAPVADPPPTQCSIPDIAAGTYHYTVTYSGNTAVAGSISEPFELVIAADTVDASNVGRNYSTFYPRKDGYRDLLTISGNRAEPIAVEIRIYNASNTRVKLVTRSRASGPYSYAWNGRNAAGTILAAGTYRIVQKLTDAAGTSKSFTSYSNLSKKILVTHTKYVTKAGKNGSAAGQTGSASVLVSSTGYAKLHASSPDYAVIGYQFQIPAATIYKSIKFQVQAKARLGVPANVLAMQNFHWCPYVAGVDWVIDCFDHVATLGNSSGALAWDSTTGSPSANRSGRIVRGLVYVDRGTVYIYKARVKVVYQTLE